MVMQNVPVSGWQRKHDAIGAAALTLFARDGYERTSVDAIAAEAGVSKRTVYSHYGDKENLFLQVLRDTYDVMRDRVRDIVDRNLRDVDRRAGGADGVQSARSSRPLAGPPNAPP